MCISCSMIYIFLSTLSLRRATYLGAGKSCDVCDFYPRSPCGERRLQIFLYYQDNNFYPRSPCGERHTPHYSTTLKCPFLSTLSLRRATLRRSASIWLERYFYPRSPCGERPYPSQCRTLASDFYPRSPCGERRLTAL